MAEIKIKCKKCGSEKVHFYGKQSGHQRCRCFDCKKTFQLTYTYKACEEGTKEKIIPMSHNGSGVRDTARVLRVSTGTVINEVKKKSRKSNM